MKVLLVLMMFGWAGCTQQGEQSDSEKIRYLESELFAANRLLFLCESEMQELYNVPGLGSRIDSIVGRMAPNIVSVDTTND